MVDTGTYYDYDYYWKRERKEFPGPLLVTALVSMHVWDSFNVNFPLLAACQPFKCRPMVVLTLGDIDGPHQNHPCNVPGESMLIQRLRTSGVNIPQGQPSPALSDLTLCFRPQHLLHPSALTITSRPLTSMISYGQESRVIINHPNSLAPQRVAHIARPTKITVETLLFRELWFGWQWPHKILMYLLAHIGTTVTVE